MFVSVAATIFNNAKQNINVYGDDIEVDYRGYEVLPVPMALYIALNQLFGIFVKYLVVTSAKVFRFWLEWFYI